MLDQEQEQGQGCKCNRYGVYRRLSPIVLDQREFVLGKEFITVYSEIKELEFDEFMKVISPWEREHLLLHV